MNLPWFKRIGIIFLPMSAIGWIISLLAISISVYEFIDIDSRSHSVSDTLINFVFRLFIVFAFYTLIAFLTSRKSKT
jgi:hypothetical protein